MNKAVEFALLEQTVYTLFMRIELLNKHRVKARGGEA
jgi:hypothetical protein